MRVSDQFKIFEIGLSETLFSILPDRPLLMLSIWLNYIFFGTSAFSYKFINLLLHIATAICLFFSLKKTLTIFKYFEDAKKNYVVCLFTALIFCVHPINTTVVTTAIQRGVSMSVVFTLLAYLLWLQIFFKKIDSPFLMTARDREYYLLSLLMFVLAILSKPNIITFPFFLLCLILFLKPFDLIKRLLYIIPYFVILTIPIFYYFFAKTNLQTGALSPIYYLLAQGEVVLTYILKILMPFNFSFYNELTFKKIFTTWNYASTVLYIILFFTTIWSAFRKKNKISFFLFSYFLFIIPESSLFPILQNYFDHRNYMAMPFLVCAGLLLIFTFKKQLISKYLPAILIIYTTYTASQLVYYNTKTSTYADWAYLSLQKTPEIYSTLAKEALLQKKFNAATTILQTAETVLKKQNKWNSSFEKDIYLFKKFLTLGHLPNDQIFSFYKEKINQVLSEPVSIYYFSLIVQSTKQAMTDEKIKIPLSFELNKLILHSTLFLTQFSSSDEVVTTAVQNILFELNRYKENKNKQLDDFKIAVKNLNALQLLTGLEIEKQRTQWVTEAIAKWPLTNDEVEKLKKWPYE